MGRKNIKLSREDRVFHIISTIILVLIFLVIAYPIYFVVIASFSDPTLIYQGKIRLIPDGITFLGYERTLTNQNLLTGYKNTIFYAILGTSINVVLTMMAAYALSVKQMYGRRVVMFLITFTMYFSGGMIPSYFLVKNLNMLDSVWAMVLPGAVSAYNLMIARSFLENNIPTELFEAAEIDGCSRLMFFRKIVIPLSSTLIAILVLFYGVGHWNAYFNAMMYIQERSKFPLQVVLREILLQNQISIEDIQDPELMSAMEAMKNSVKYVIILVSSVPVMILYPFLQKYFVKGVTIGSVKG